MKSGRLIVLIIVIILGIQLYHPAKTNPTSNASASLLSRAQMPADVHAALQRACADCHSNATVWPWYAKVAPISWVVIDDVNEGRRHFNMSEWGNTSAEHQAKKLDDICDEVKDGGMPLKSYTWIHRGTELSPAERASVCAWTQAERQRVAATRPEKANSPAR
jgi:heme-binding protein